MHCQSPRWTRRRVEFTSAATFGDQLEQPLARVTLVGGGVMEPAATHDEDVAVAAAVTAPLQSEFGSGIVGFLLLYERGDPLMKFFQGAAIRIGFAFCPLHVEKP